MQVGVDKRWFVIGLLSLTQLICILGVGSIGLRGIESRFQSHAYHRALDENVQVLRAVSKYVRRQGLRDFQAGSADCKNLQQLTATLRLPNDGRVTVVRASDGQLIGMPDPGPSAAWPQGADHLPVAPVEEADCHLINLECDSCGITRLNNRQVVLTVHVLDDLGLVLQAYQEYTVLLSSIHDQLLPLRTVGLASALALTVLTAAVGVVIVRRYDNHLESINRRLEHKVHDRSMALMKTRNAVIFGLAKLAESRDNDTGKHLERIRKYVTLLSQKLKTSHGLSLQYVEDLAFASSLHDIGKVGVPDAILLKRGLLTPDERTIIEQHAEIGGRCLEAIQRQLGNDDFLELAKLIAFTHHERWDGNGYPFGLTKEKIPLAGRIVAVADVYDALTSKRPYKRAFPHQEAYQLIVSGAGTQFDPDVVAAFVHQADDFAQIAAELADTQEDPAPPSPPPIPTTELLPRVAANLTTTG